MKKLVIPIVERLKPFSHQPGYRCLLPGSHFVLELFPCLVRVYHFVQHEWHIISEFSLDFQGPVQDFTVIQDLEKGNIQVAGVTCLGYFSYSLRANDSGARIQLVVKKSPSQLLPRGFIYEFQLGENSIDFPFVPYVPDQLKMRLSFGNHKSQEWERFCRRGEMMEIVPILFRSASMLPNDCANYETGTLPILDEIQSHISNVRPEFVLDGFKKLFSACFYPYLIPRFNDPYHQGIAGLNLECNAISPFVLMKQAQKLIYSCFIQESESCLNLLPCLPPKLVCGRFISVPTSFGVIHMEWSKNFMRRLVIEPSKNITLKICPKKAVRARYWKSSVPLQSQSKATSEVLYFKEQEVVFEQGNIYYFDRFEV